MAFRKIQTIRVSERVFDLVCSELDCYATDYKVKIDGWLETFNNCREQGYCLFVDSVDWDNENRTKGMLHIFACECRNSDNIMVICQTEYPSFKGMFSEKAYNNFVDKDHINPEKESYTFYTQFGYNEIQRAASFIVEIVKDYFKSEFKNK